MPAARLNPSRRSNGMSLWLSLAFRKGDTHVPSGTRNGFVVEKTLFMPGTSFGLSVGKFVHPAIATQNATEKLTIIQYMSL
jgi:hypothetical protein